MLYCICGPACSGKDAVVSELSKKYKRVVQHTTRPMRPGETDGVEYVFHDRNDIPKTPFNFKSFTVASGEEWCYWFEFEDIVSAITSGDVYITISDAAGTKKLMEWARVKPIMLNTRVITRLKRYYTRESEKDNPNYEEIIRRIIADENDFAQLTFSDRVVHILNDDGKTLEDVVKDVEYYIRRSCV